MVWSGAMMLDHLGHRLFADRLARDVEGADMEMRGRWIAIYLLGGLIGLPIGANLLVEGAVDGGRSRRLPVHQGPERDGFAPAVAVGVVGSGPDAVRRGVLQRLSSEPGVRWVFL